MSGIMGMKRVAALCATALVAGCGGGGSSGGSAAGSGSVIVAPTPTPSPSASPAPTPSPSPSPSPTASPTTWAGAAAALYDTLPDIATCRAGVLKASAKVQALEDVNRIRALHGLAPVTYSDADDAQTAEASLMMAANNALSHTPPSSWTCYTATGSTGAGSSNLYLGRGNGLGFASSDDHMAAWLNEGGTASLGHRRWILHPFLGKISYGRVTQQRSDGTRYDSGTLKVFSFTGGRPAPSVVPRWIAFPQGDYPVRYFRPTDYLSFSLAPSNTADGSDARVDFSAARISVMNGTTAMAVTDQSSDNVGYGLANNVQWRVTGLVAGVTYTVRISGIARAPATEYSYSFRIVS